MKSWNVEDLKAALKKQPSVKAWTLQEEHLRRLERYFLKESDGRLGLDQERDVRQHTLSLRVMVKKSDPKRQGEASAKLYTSIALDAQLQRTIDEALQTDYGAWELPAVSPESLPEVKSFDPSVSEDIEGVMRRLSSDVDQFSKLARETQFNSAEVFVSLHDREVHVSNGFKNRFTQTRIYSEAAFSLGAVDEYLSTQWNVSLKDFSIQKLFDDCAKRAKLTGKVVKPESGHYPVIVDADVLGIVMPNHMGALSARRSFKRLPFISVGQDFVAGATGDLLTVDLDPSLDFGADSVPVSETGSIQKPLRLVEKNKVLATVADPQYGHYLNLKPTTTRGNMNISGGTLTLEEMRRSAPKVLEILQFSALFDDAISGTFSSEIRLAVLHDNEKQTQTVIKGGSLSGSIAENFPLARYTKARVMRSSFSSGEPRGSGYYGPEYGLLQNVSVVS